MSEKATVNFGDEKLVFNRVETVWGPDDSGNETKINQRDQDNYLTQHLDLNRDDLKAWKDYRKDPLNFDTTAYYEKYAEAHNLRPVEEESALSKVAAVVTAAAANAGERVKDVVGKKNSDTPAAETKSPVTAGGELSEEQKTLIEAEVKKQVAELTRELVKERDLLKDQNRLLQEQVKQLQEALRSAGSSEAPKTEPSPQEEQEKLEQSLNAQNIDVEALFNTYKAQRDQAISDEEADVKGNPAALQALLSKQRETIADAFLDALPEDQKATVSRNELVRYLELRDNSDPAIKAIAEGTIEPKRKDVKQSSVTKVRSKLPPSIGQYLPAPKEYYEDDQGVYYVDKNGERVDINEKKIEKKNRGKLLGAVALGALAGILVWEYFEDRHFGHSPSREARQSGLFYVGPPKSGNNSPINVLDITGGSRLSDYDPSSGRHIDYYNQAFGHRMTGVENPPTLHLAGTPRHEQLVDSANRVVVKKVGWDTTGVLDKLTLKTLRENHWNVGYGHRTQLGKRFLSLVWNKQ